MYVSSKSYGVCGRVCYILASASTQLAISIHLIIRKPTLFSRRDDVRVFASEAFVGKSAGLGGCPWRDRDGTVGRLIPQGRQLIMWKNPGTEVRDNRIGFRVGFRVDMKVIHSCRYQAFRVCTCAWLARAGCREPAIFVVVGDDRTCAVYGCKVRFPVRVGTVACGQGENSVVTAIPRVFNCDALSEQWRRHVARKVTVAVFDVACTLNFEKQHLTTHVIVATMNAGTSTARCWWLFAILGKQRCSLERSATRGSGRDRVCKMRLT